MEAVLDGYGIERSSVSRHFVRATAQQLEQLCQRRLEDRELLALVIDGLEVAGQTLVVALGVARGGSKHVLGLWQGATENPTVVKALLEDLGRSLSSTNLIESCLSGVRHVTRNVKRWRGGDHVARWTAAGLLEAERKVSSG